MFEIQKVLKHETSGVNGLNIQDSRFVCFFMSKRHRENIRTNACKSQMGQDQVPEEISVL